MGSFSFFQVYEVKIVQKEYLSLESGVIEFPAIGILSIRLFLPDPENPHEL